MLTKRRYGASGFYKLRESICNSGAKSGDRSVVVTSTRTVQVTTFQTREPAPKM